MKKIIIFAIIAALVTIGIISATGFNKQIIDLTYQYDYAIIYNFDGSIIKEGKVSSWADYEGEQLQVTFDDGSTYLTNSFRCDLIKNK